MEDWEWVLICISAHVEPPFVNAKQRASFNKYVVGNRLFISGYLQVEDAVRRTPKNKMLPSWITLGGIKEIPK